MHITNFPNLAWFLLQLPSLGHYHHTHTYLHTHYCTYVPVHVHSTSGIFCAVQPTCEHDNPGHCLYCRCTQKAVTGDVLDTQKQSAQHKHNEEVLFVGMETSKHERVRRYCPSFAVSLSLVHVLYVCCLILCMPFDLFNS